MDCHAVEAVYRRLCQWIDDELGGVVNDNFGDAVCRQKMLYRIFGFIDILQIDLQYVLTVHALARVPSIADGLISTRGKSIQESITQAGTGPHHKSEGFCCSLILLTPRPLAVLGRRPNGHF